MALTKTIRAAKTQNRFALPPQFLGKRAFCKLIRPPEKHFFDFCAFGAEEVVYVPEKLLLFSKMPLHPLLQVALGRANVHITAFFELDIPQRAHSYGDVFAEVNFERIDAVQVFNRFYG